MTFKNLGMMGLDHVQFAVASLDHAKKLYQDRFGFTPLYRSNGSYTDKTGQKSVVYGGGKARIIDFALSNAINSGIRRIGVATQYKAQSLIQHLQRGWSFLDGRFDEFVDILPAQQRVSEDWYQGTADAVFQNLDLIRRNKPEYVVVLSGDHVYKMDYDIMLAEHVARGADLSVACIDVPLAEASEYGVIRSRFSVGQLYCAALVQFE